MRLAYFALCLISCAELPASMVVKPPLQSQCQRLPIKGCGELVDGVLLYAEGDKPGAMQKLAQVKQENTPAELAKFGQALRQAAELPGVSGLAQPLNQVADLLDSGAPAKPEAPKQAAVTIVATVPAAAPAKPEEPFATVLAPRVAEVHEHYDSGARATSASADVNRIVSESHLLSAKEGRIPCKIEGVDAICFKGLEGPLVISDVIGSSVCSDRQFIAAAESDTPDFGFHWSFEARATPITGARFAVRGGEWLYFVILPGKKGLSESPECQIAWSGFRPWIVPGMTNEDQPGWHKTIETH
jgi:hypothetical protein